MTTLIVGCGYLGRRLGRLLKGRGEAVFGTVRSEASASRAAALGITPVIADVLSPATLRGLPAADRVFYCVGFDRAAGASMRSVYVEGLAHFLRGWEGRAGAFVYASATSVYGRNDGGWVDEETPTEPLTDSGRTCLEAEQVLARLVPDRVILRYSGLYGPGRIVRKAALEAGGPIAGDPERWLNLIHRDDAAAAAVAALERGAPGQSYLASDDRPLRRREYYERAAALLGAPAPRFVAPEAGSPAAAREEANKRVSNRRIKAELGLALLYPEIDTGLAAAVGAESD